ncbi:MAG: hypothetical protein QY319_07985 [Candidatus Kapaibacterium sp.]|nr:hypothetical protein [Candidatus Kapabacteria bacterium]MCC6330941.1 hypothetical protein [Ignavibacteria bacterium]NOG67338.1 hypothetical protein [Chlorobiota bacterium]MBZ0195529.1 hypothetical protein [Candidatus Kapabacteria bacterium]MCL4276508.1 hypothetical protein [Ignavibacteria bacterium]
MKKVLIGIVSLLVAYIAIKLLWWIFSFTISLIIGLVQFVIVGLLAVAIYLYLSRRVFR